MEELLQHNKKIYQTTIIFRSNHNHQPFIFLALLLRERVLTNLFNDLLLLGIMGNSQLKARLFFLGLLNGKRP